MNTLRVSDYEMLLTKLSSCYKFRLEKKWNEKALGS
jgi:hypothetical protein